MDEVMFAELLESVREGMAILRGEAEPSRVTTINVEQALAQELAKPKRVATSIRLPNFVHHMLRLQAQREGISLNALITSVLSEHTEAAMTAARQQLLQRIAVDERVMVGQPVIRGTRLTVKYILNVLVHGATVDEILREYDGLTVDDIQACLLFAQMLEQSDLTESSISEAIEDSALGRAIDEAVGTETVDRDEVFRLLGSEDE